MNTSAKPRAVIVGGSLSGLFAATTLRQAGWDVDVFELSPNELDSRGGGIVLQPDVLAAFRFAGMAFPERLGVESGDRIYLDRDDNLIEQFTMPQTQTSWNLLYTTMKQALPAESLHAGEAFTGFDIEGEEVVAHFATGRSERADLLIGADGARSSVRRVLLPEVAPSYAGYVAWRGLVPENALPQQAADVLRDRFTFQQGPEHSALAYLARARTARPRPASAAGTGSGIASRHAVNSISCWSIATASNARSRCPRAPRKRRISTFCAPLPAHYWRRRFRRWSPRRKSRSCRPSRTYGCPGWCSGE
jgi:2-polyprenyl-6-methoxyphenol hydroxylase-like FAD-dependent oxidoreductase